MEKEITTIEKKAKPFLRWAGGKKWLLKQLESIVDIDSFNNYHEPFVGGGSVFFKFSPKTSFISDSNEWLIETIQSSCQLRANAENKKNYKDGINKRVEWTEMFNINDYKKIIEDYWSKKPEPMIDNFITFEKTFSIDIGIGKNKKDLLKWVSYFNSYRNQLAHEGSKNKGINKKEVDELKVIHDHFFNKT